VAELSEIKGAAREIERKGGFPGLPNHDLIGNFEEKLMD